MVRMGNSPASAPSWIDAKAHGGEIRLDKIRFRFHEFRVNALKKIRIRQSRPCSVFK